MKQNIVSALWLLSGNPDLSITSVNTTISGWKLKGIKKDSYGLAQGQRFFWRIVVVELTQRDAAIALNS